MSNPFKQLTVPTLLLNERICRDNIKTMAEKAVKSNTVFRPHFKTHQSAQIGEWFRQEGVEAITVSSVKMAQYFADNDWGDITVAFPFNIHESKQADELAGKINLNLVVESVTTAEYIGKHFTNQVNVFVKIDTGYHRAGISALNNKTITDVVNEINSHQLLIFKGFLAHAGNSYNAKDKLEIEMIYNKNFAVLNDLKQAFLPANPDIIISVGDTPTCSIVKGFDEVDEVRPGVFALYDVMQHYIGSCSLNQIAVAMACPIVAKHKRDLEFIVYGGGVHFAKDAIETKEFGTIYGLPVELKDSVWTSPLAGCWVKSLSQEHGIIKVSEQVFEKYEVSDFIGVLPIHACMAVNSMKEMVTLRGEKISCMN